MCSMPFIHQLHHAELPCRHVTDLMTRPLAQVYLPLKLQEGDWI
jgi:hypothetical protein